MKTHLLINQTVGPLFNEFIKAVSEQPEKNKVVVLTGNPPKNVFSKNVQYYKFTRYNTKNYFTRICTWVLFFFQILFYLLKKPSFDTITVTSNPPIMLYGIVFLMMPFSKNKIKFLSYDIYPEVISSYLPNIKSNLFYRLWIRLDFFLMNRVTNIFVISEQMKNTYINRSKKYGEVSTLNPIVLPITGCDQKPNIDSIRKLKNELKLLESECIFIYTGNFGRGHDFKTILDAINSCQRNDVRFLFYGDGINKNYLINESKINKKIEVYNYLNDSDYISLLSISDYCFVSIRADAANFMVPSKIVSYAMSGASIISVSPEDSNLCKLVVNNNIGYNFENNKSNLLLDFINASGKIKHRDMRKRTANEIFGSNNLKNLVSKYYE